MTQFMVHTKESAPDDAQEILEKVQGSFGFIPNLLGVLSEAPIAAEAYVSLMTLCRRSSLTPTELHVVWFAINHEHNCEYCMAAHSAVAAKEEVPQTVIDATRRNVPYADERLQALREFTQAVVVERGDIAPELVDEFLASGFTKRNVLEILVAVSAKVLSNYANHIADTPLDEAFSACEWKKAS